MNRRIVMMVSALVIAGLMGSAPVKSCFADEAGDLKETVKKALWQRVRVTGTLDLFDAKINAVRHLKMMDFQGDVVQKGDQLSAVIDYRDIDTGDVVTVNATLAKKDSAWDVTETVIASVKEAPKVDENKVYSDAELQTFMNEYLQAQVKFTGTLMLFDEDRNKMRKLELVSLDGEVRRLGTLSISRATFKDKDSGETLGVDVTVENKKGKLSVQALRIREVKP